MSRHAYRPSHPFAANVYRLIPCCHRPNTIVSYFVEHVNDICGILKRFAAQSAGLARQGALIAGRSIRSEHAFFYTRSACLRSELHPSQKQASKRWHAQNTIRGCCSVNEYERARPRPLQVWQKCHCPVLGCVTAYSSILM